MERQRMGDIPVLRGTLDVIVLRSILGGPLHGFEISEWIAGRSGGDLDIRDSALYQALYRLESKRLVTASWGVTGNNRRARYYAITAAGRRHLQRETERWVRYASSVSAILVGAGSGEPGAGGLPGQLQAEPS